MGRGDAAAVLVACCLLMPKITLAQPQDPPTDDAHQPVGQQIGELEAERVAREGANLAELEQRIEELEAERVARDDADVAQLEQRIEELEAERVARDDATRSIIAQALSGLGSRINESVDFSGVIEVLAGRTEDFRGGDERNIELNTLEMQFDIWATDWARGSVTLEYETGDDLVFTTTRNGEFSIDRFNVDEAYVTLGNTERFWPYGTFGRMVVPFGISTGDPVADVLNIVDPLTVQVFEMKQDAILIGLDFPTTPPTPQVVTPAPPLVKPVAVAPAVGRLARLLGYKPPPTPPPIPRFISPPAELPPYTLGVYFYNGDTHEDPSRAGEWDLHHHLGATAGYRTKGKCRPYLGGEQAPEDLNWLHIVCPWTLEVDVDYTGSVFDSDFLSRQYRAMLGPEEDPTGNRFGLNSIGFVPGLAASLKTSLGPVAIVAEWNGALKTARFQQDDGQPIRIQPRAWQVSFAYQFGWKPWVEAIGAQGTYLTVNYSQSRDLSGVRRIINLTDPLLVGAVPEKRLAIGAGEWVLPNVRLAIEYAHAWNYSETRRNFADLPNPPIKGESDAILAVVTLDW